jgi:hypothetical protein
MNAPRTMPRQKHAGGRPSAITPAVVAKLIEAFKLDVTAEEACLYAGISKDTYYRKVKVDQGFSDEMEQARQYATLVARQTVIRQIGEDGDLALKYLERKRKEEFSPRAEHHVSGVNLAELVAKREQSAVRVDWEHPNLDAIEPHGHRVPS